MELIYQTGDDLALHITNVTKSSGEKWIQKNLGNTRFQSGGMLQQAMTTLNGRPTSVTFGNTMISSGFENEYEPKHHILHELGHVLDNNYSSSLTPGELSDQFTKSFGGEPQGLNF